MAHHHKLDCLVKRLDCSVVVKVNVTEKVKNSSKCYLDDISSAADLLLPNSVWCRIIISQSVTLEDWFAIFKVKVTVRAHITKI